MTILAVNAGSSSLKFSLYPVRDGRICRASLSGQIEGLEPGGEAALCLGGNREVLSIVGEQRFDAALDRLRVLLGSLNGLSPLRAVAHRVVHGGEHYTRSVQVTEEVLATLATLNSLAPLHQPHNLAGIKAFVRAFPGVPQVACFDTAFHATQSDIERRFALPIGLHRMGVRRYGFHGLSYQFIRSELLTRSGRAQARVIMAHLGNGASLCGMLGGQSVVSTMGFSALDGLMMGTRSGALDPGVLLYLMEQGWDLNRLQRLLYRESGLLGVSGKSADMRVLRAASDPACKEAISLFTRRVIREIGALCAVLEGADILSFSGGIGEHDALLRADVCTALGWLGLKLDPTQNLKAKGDVPMAIHAADSAVEVWVVPTDEGSVAADEALTLIQT